MPADDQNHPQRRCRQAAAVYWSVMCALFTSSVGAEDFHIGERDGTVDVEIDGQLFATYCHQGFAKPILYPIIGPHGIGMTRNWPMKEVPGEPVDHPHQKSMWFAHGDVNGVDFWTESRASGHIVQTKLLRAEAGKDRATIKTANAWISPQGQVILTDTRLLTFFLTPSGRAIDYRIELQASHGSVTFGDTKEGVMGIRVRPELQLQNDPAHGATTADGQIINSEGVRGLAAWGKRAKWVDCWGKVEGKTIGVAVFDHPCNLRHPTWWHARDYGLIAANPFGIHDFEQGKPAGTGKWTIVAGKSITFRYRFLFHECDPKTARIAQLYEQYAKER